MQNKLKKYLLVIICGLAPYWFMNATIWIPWLFSRILGLILMIIFVPILWGFFSYVCLRIFDITERLKIKWYIALIFLAEAILSDLFFLLIWRQLPLSELYHWTTFASYMLVFFIPIIISFFMRKVEKSWKVNMNRQLIYISLFVFVSFATTLYCVRYW